jgi:RNA polymerase sigma-70 factor (ECF subfamily)
VDAAENVLEANLLRRACSGDYDAFDELHTRLLPPVTRFVRRLVGMSSEADDVVQDTFVSLYANMERIDPPEMLRPYLFRIARNRAYDLLRRGGRYEQVSIDEDEDDPFSVRVSFEIADERTPDDAADWLLLHVQVRDAIDDLPELQRQALIMYAEEEMTYQEIAEAMDVSIGTIKSRIFHAKRNLREALGGDVVDAIIDALGDDEE